MIPDDQFQVAPVVCEPCKRRKKRCDKSLPACGRCSRLFAKCWYTPASSESGNTVGSTNGNTTLPPLVDVIPGFISQPPPSLPIKDSNPNLSLTGHRVGAGVEDQVSSQVWKLLNTICRKRGSVSLHCATYFSTFNKSLPLVDERIFYEILEKGYSNTNNGIGECHFDALLLGIFLITYLSPSYTTGCEGEELYSTLKSIFSLLQSTGSLTLELLQLGVLIASWEYCQAKKKEAWLSVGSCVRMAQMLGLHDYATQLPPDNEVKEKWFENRRCVWWCVVVLERLVNQEYMGSTLPFASAGPTEQDFLPLITLKDGIDYCVKDEILLPGNVDLANPDQEPREFTRFGPFATTIQMTHLTDLTTKHILDQSKSPAQREIDSAKLDVALQNFSGACIPPPGQAEGKYCGPFGLRTSTAFSLHFYKFDMATQSGDEEGIIRATSALLSISRFIIYATKVSFQGVPMDFDGIAFWAHRIAAIAALVHIQFGERNEEWEEDLEMLKKYLRYYTPRYKLYANYLKEIEAAETSTMVG